MSNNISVREADLDRNWGGWPVVDQGDHLLYRLGDTAREQSQLPITDYRPDVIRAWRAAEDFRYRHPSLREKDWFDLKLVQAAQVVIAEETLATGLVLPYLSLISQPNFLPDEEGFILTELHLDPGDVFLLNSAWWAWTSSSESEQARTLVAITSNEHPLIVRDQDSDLVGYTVLASQSITLLSDEVAHQIEHNQVVALFADYLR